MKLTASWTVLMCSASSSGISTSNSSSIAITSSTMSRESAPRSSMKADSALISSSPTPSCSAMMLLTLASTVMRSSFQEKGPEKLSARPCSTEKLKGKPDRVTYAAAWRPPPVAGKARSSLLAKTVDAVEAALAVEIGLATPTFGTHHALAVEAGFRPGAVPIVVALLARAAPRALADADAAYLALATVALAGAHHGAFAFPAAIAGKALLPAGLRRGGDASPVAVSRRGIAVPEGLVLAGAAPLDDGSVGVRRGGASFRSDALEAVGAVEVLGAGLRHRLLGGRRSRARVDDGDPCGEGDEKRGERTAHLNTSASVAFRLSGSLTVKARSFFSIRRARLESTFPGPTSTRVSTPESAIRWTDSTQRTGEVTWLRRSSTMRPGSVFGSAVTLATIGAEGCLNVTAARTWASRGCTGAMSEQWKGALTGKGTARFAPFSLHRAMARSTAEAWPAMTVCSGEL